MCNVGLLSYLHFSVMFVSNVNGRAVRFDLSTTAQIVKNVGAVLHDKHCCCYAFGVRAPGSIMRERRFVVDSKQLNGQTNGLRICRG